MKMKMMMDKGMLEAKTWYMVFWACIALMHFIASGYVMYKLHSLDKNIKKVVHTVEKKLEGAAKE